MGQDFGQEREWSEARELDWFLLENPLNRGMQTYVGELLKLYHKYSCLYELDKGWQGFEWLNADDKDRSIYSFFRKNSTGKNNLMFVLNMTPVARENYVIGVPRKKKYKLVLNSDDTRFGGNGNEIPAEIMAKDGECNYRDYTITFTLPAYTAAVFTF